MAAHELPAFDPAIIERYVENTYRKATAVFLGSVVAGVMIGAIFGAMPLTSLGSSWPIPRLFGFATMMIGAIVGGVIGYLIGDTRAFLARLQGQTALAQIEAAKDARLALESIQQIQALAMRRAASSARPQPQTEPTPQPAPTPAPVAPVAPPVTPVPAPVEAAPPLVEAAPPLVEAASPVVESVPAPAEAVPPPAAPPTLVVAGAAPAAEISPPVSPPLSS